MAEQLTLGAESIIFRLDQWDREFILKHRPPKPYLLKAIDDLLKLSRTNRECKMLTVARSLGVPTPAVLWIDRKQHTIAMDFINGTQLKQLVSEASERKLRELCEEFGRLIGLLHDGGVVHGDPTTSNVIVDKQSKVWLIDFGLAEMNATVEMKGVDIHLMRRAFETTHWDLEDTMLESALVGYRRTMREEAEEVLSRANEIRTRGRYH
ncbi:MAG: Kae1-associated serine/threonine protein kinase [Candidatus Thorarchaeota archaeon]|nr:MAG: Kae1-associated serine/threonine protein kinase [Candidatus Thorarchaeota archaeon]